MGDELKVIGASGSLTCTRVEWALKLKGVEYEYIVEDLMNKSPMLLNYNPVHKKVPVLLHHGQPIAESLVILEYIDDKWKVNPSLPHDPYDRAMARFWDKFADEKCLVGVREAFRAEGEEKEKAIGSAQESLALLEKEIEGKKFFGGEDIGFLDLVVGWMSIWLGVMEEVGGMKVLEVDKFPSLHEWTQNFIEIPLIKECLPPREILVSYFQFGFTHLLSLASNKP